jgi:multidrug efflux pump subunit AcrA (membrane-fusion protein)
MALRGGSWAVSLVLGAASLTGAQPSQGPGNPNQVAAKVERAPLYLTPPDRYRVTTVVEPLRKVAVMAPSDGVLRTLAVPVGSTVREGQEIARLDTNGAMARLKIAMASVKEMQAEFDAVKQASRTTTAAAIAEARLDAAKARGELAQMEVESCTLRAPFSGRIMDVLVSPGQYLSRGTTILEIDDVSSVRVLLPVDRTAVTVGGNVNFTVEGSGVTGRAQAVMPLTEGHATLRELASPLAAAWVIVANPTNTLEPGQRAQSPYLPNAPIAGVASYSILKDEAGNPIVQVIRAERVADVPIRILGILGPDRTQVSGPFRASDVLIQTTSVPLRAGTFIRFNDAASRGVEGQPPPADQVGEAAEVGSPGVAPIGAGGRAKPGTRPSAPGAATKPAAGGGVVPF